jgi:hypothetical protein
MSGRAALNDAVLTVKENCLTNLQNVLARLRHLVLSGLIFCSIKQVDENYFHIVLISDIQHVSNRGGV